MKLHPSPVKLAAVDLGLEVATPEKSRAADFVEVLRNLEPEALLVASYGQILSQAVLDSANRGGINLHGSILPKYRGAAPIQRAILNGEKTVGVTLMRMDRGMDTGDMIEVADTPLGPDETYGELQDRLAQVAADLATRWMPRILAGDYPRTPQDGSLATFAPKVDKSEARLDLLEGAGKTYLRFRAFTPSPGAFLHSTQGLLKIARARTHELPAEVGVVASVKDGLLVGCGDGCLEILELQPEGKRRMSGRDFANGAHLRPGACLV